MKPSELAKQLGFKSLQEACDLVDVTPRTLINWQTTNPYRYRAVMLGAAYVKQSQIAAKLIDNEEV